MQDEIGHGGVGTSTSPLSLPGLLALSLRREQPNRWKGFATVGIRKLTAQGSKPSLSLYHPLFQASQIYISLGESKAERTGWGAAGR